MRKIDHATKGAGNVGAAVGRQAPKAKQVAKQRDQAISQHISHYAENPRVHAQALRKLGYTADHIRVVHRNQTRPLYTGPRAAPISDKESAVLSSPAHQAARQKRYAAIDRAYKAPGSDHALGSLGSLENIVEVATGIKPSHPLRNKIGGSAALNIGLGVASLLPGGKGLRAGVKALRGVRGAEAAGKVAAASPKTLTEAEVTSALHRAPGVDSRPAAVVLKDGSRHVVNPLHPIGNGEIMLLNGNLVDARVVTAVHAGDGSLMAGEKAVVAAQAGKATAKARNVKAGEAAAKVPGAKRLYTEEGPLTREEAQHAAGKQVRDALPSARKAAAEQKQVYKAARGEKFGKAQVAGAAAGGGTAGYKAELGQLKGQLPKVKFERLMKGTLNQADLESLFKNVENHPNLTYGETLTGRAALIKAFQEGHALAPHEIKVLSKAFGEDVGKVLAHKSFPRRVGENALGVLNLPRALMASIDVSFPGRQGLGVLAAAPDVWAKGFKPQFRGMVSEAYYQKMLKHLHADPAFEQATEGGVKFTELGKGGANREEPFVTSLLTDRPAKYNPIRMSARAYTMYGDYVRLELFKKYLAKAERQGVDITNKNELRGIAKVVNTLSGRGGGRRLQQAAPVISPLVFAPQLIASRLNMLNPIWYTRLGGVESAFARRQARIAGARLGVGAAAVLGGAAAAGAKVQTDPRNSDFAKIRLGNTRIDILGGLQQYPRAASQIASGKLISSTTGRTMTLGPGFGQMSRKDILERFVQSKASPPASVAADLLQGKTFQGQPISAKQEALSHLTPLSIQDAVDLAHNKGGSLPKAVAGYALAASGVGVQTYGPNLPHQKKLQKFVKNELAQAIKATPGAKMTPLLKGRLALRMERVKAREAVDVHDPVKRLSADIDVIRRHKWITAQQAAEWKQHLRKPGLTGHDYGDVSRYLTTHFFDQGHELSSSIRYLQENGNPELKLPAIP